MMKGLDALTGFNVNIHMPKIGDIAQCLEEMCGGDQAKDVYFMQEDIMNDALIDEEGDTDYASTLNPNEIIAAKYMQGLALQLKNQIIPSPLPIPDISKLPNFFSPFV
jgi:hypothetical protein